MQLIEYMKLKFIFFGIMFFILACSPNIKKPALDPLTTLLDSIVKNRKEKIVILDKRIPNKRTLEIFKGNYTLNENNTLINETYQSRLFDREEFDKLQKSCTDTITKYWSRKDFKNFNTVISENSKYIANNTYKDFGDIELKLFAFSDPISYMNDKYVLFTVLISNTTFSPPNSQYVIIMERQGNSWKVIDKIGASDFIN
jgi:hypothetical protein